MNVIMQITANRKATSVEAQQPVPPNPASPPVELDLGDPGARAIAEAAEKVAQAVNAYNSALQAHRANRG